VLGQSSFTPNDSPATAPDPVLRRIERARALAAAHQLESAANELENVRASVKDLALRNVTTLMLMGIYLEEGNYSRSQALLEEAFQARAAQKDESIRTYFAMAGQAINGVRSHLGRYRSYGINTADAGLPGEAVTDLDRVRALLERMVAQAKEIGKEDGRAYDALALQEDVLGLRLSLSRDNEDRDKWEAEYVAAREKLASSQVQIASIGRLPALGAVAAKIPNPFTSPKPSGASEGNAAKKEETPSASPGSQPTTGASAAEPSASQPSSDAGRVASAPKPEANEPPLISAGSLTGRETKRVTPAYPQIAKNAGITGTVRVFAIVDENGKVWVTNSEGPSVLRRVAEDAARGWIFPPTLVDGKPVRVAGYLDFEFKL
jgi:TonB family protein